MYTDRSLNLKYTVGLYHDLRNLLRETKQDIQKYPRSYGKIKLYLVDLESANYSPAEQFCPETKPHYISSYSALLNAQHLSFLVGLISMTVDGRNDSYISSASV